MDIGEIMSRKISTITRDYFFADIIFAILWVSQSDLQQNETSPRGVSFYKHLYWLGSCHRYSYCMPLSENLQCARFWATYLTCTPIFFFGRPMGLVGFKFPDQGLNLGHGSESLES